MVTERVTIQVESNIGEDGPLTVMDTLHQLIDAFDLLTAAIAQESGGGTVRWRLVSMSKNSPASLTGEAYSSDPTLSIAPVVYRGKRRFSEGLAELADGRVAPWLEQHSILAKSFFRRNLNGVGRTVFDLGDDAPRATVVEKVARRGLNSLEAFELAREAEVEDKSRKERGTLDAHVSEAKTWRGRPALYVKERLSGKIIPCVLSEKAAQEAGPTHSWQDAWSSKRVRIKGQIFYDQAGAISRVLAEELKDVNPEPVDLAELRRLNLTNGLTPVEHLDRYWGYGDE